MAGRGSVVIARLVIDEGAELGSGAAVGFQSLDQELLLHLGIGQRAADFHLQPVGDRGRHEGP